VSVENTRPAWPLSSRLTKGVSKKLKTKAKAKGMKIRRPKYNIAMARARAIHIDDLEDAVELEERIEERINA
jgi:hypothetical protein